MFALGSLAFAAPWLLTALAALPVIWWLLRVTPPAPRRVAFPAIRLLLGLTPREETPARTPWWLILLRTVLAALIILALAHPLLNPRGALSGGGPLVLVIDDGWAAARDWARRQTAATDLLAEAERENRRIILVTTAPLGSGEPAPPLSPVRASDARAAVQALQPKPWPADRKLALERLRAMQLPQGTASVWISDGVEHDPAGDAQAERGAAADLAAFLEGRGTLRYVAAEEADAPRLLLPESAAGGAPSTKEFGVVVHSLPAALPRPVTVRANAADGALLGRETATIEPGENRAALRLPMPAELRNRVVRVEIEGEESAGGVLLIDELWRRRPVGIATAPNTAGQPLLSEDYYIERALAPFTELRRGVASDLLKRELAVLIYSDSGPNSPGEEAEIRDWIGKGGVLLRFAGPHLAEHGDKLLPVRLRRGGRTMGGALSWDQPAQLAPFAPDSPFAGMAIPSRCDGNAAGAGRARYRAGEQDLGAACRRDAAGDRREDRQRLDRAGAYDREYRVVEPRDFRAVRRNAAARRRDEPGRDRGERRRAAADRDARRVWPIAATAAIGAADIGHRNRDRDAVAAAPARLLRCRRFAARAEPVERRHRDGADRNSAGRGRASRLRPEKRRGRFAPAAADRRFPAGAD